MKKLNIIMLLVGLLVFISCTDDNDSNPTFKEPTKFVLNTPKYASGIYDLKNTESVQLTCSQPDYGFTAVTKYVVEISLTEDFEEYKTLYTSYTTALMEVDAEEIAIALSELLGYPDEESYPENYIFPVYVRLQSSLSNSGKGEIASNIIKLPKVLSYFALTPVTMPDNLYLAGNITDDWNWDKSTSMVPVHSNAGKFWAIQYLGLDDDGQNAEIKFNIAKAEDGNEVGIDGVIIDEESIERAGISGEDNIVIGNPGWYLVVVTTEIVGRDYKFNVEFLPPNIYLTGYPSGGWDVFDESHLFTVPEGKGEFVSPTFLAVPAGEDPYLRMCVKLNDQIEWWKTEFVILGGKIAYRGTGGDQERVTVTAGQKAYLNFIEGTGKVQ